jgi:hypothetical protein
MNTNVTVLRDRDVTYGVGFEVARDALLAIAGGVFRTYLALKNEPGADPDAVASAHANYVAARRRALALRVSDVAGIKAVLGGAA